MILMKKYIDEWENAIVIQGHEYEHGTGSICAYGEFPLDGEANERQKERINKIVYEALYRQAFNEKRKYQST